jgi:hypothetical protein
MNTDTLTKADMKCAMDCATHILEQTERGIPRRFKPADICEQIDVAIAQLERFPEPYPGSFRALMLLRERRQRFAPIEFTDEEKAEMAFAGRDTGAEDN